MELVLGDVDSIYLCRKCGHLLYVQISTNREACLNRACVDWPVEFSDIVDPQPEAQQKLYAEIKEKKSLLIQRIQACDLAELRRYVYLKRMELAQSLLEQGVMWPIDRWFATGELLLLTNKLGPTGLHTPGLVDDQRFASILEDVTNWSRLLRFLEDLKTERYVVLRQGTGSIETHPFRIKYSTAIEQSNLAMGLTSRSRIEQQPELFRYQEIETKATPRVDVPSDLTDLLDAVWPATLMLRHGLRSHDRTSKQYGYNVSVLDLTVLAGWWSLQPRDGTSRIPRDKERAKLAGIEAHFTRYPTLGRTTEQFVAEYIDSKDRVPIVLRTPDGWLLDKWTLLFFMVYLQGDPKMVVQGSPKFAEPLLQRMQGRAGKEFENWIRRELNKAGFSGPDDAIPVGKYEYDILKISEARQMVVLGDAKYRELSPSSFTGKNLIKQELTGAGSLLDESQRQNDRLDYFKSNLDKFEGYLQPKRPLTDYQVKSYLILKHIPLIARYQDTALLRAHEFLTSLAAQRGNDSWAVTLTPPSSP